MSITTGRGDGGETDLLFGRRAPKNDLRIVAVGAVDELSACLGVARCEMDDESPVALIAEVQQTLIGLMGELACLPEDFEKYRSKGYPSVETEQVAALEASIAQEEVEAKPLEGWAIPGAGRSLTAARLDLARTVCRRAERAVIALDPVLPQALCYLNRLSDLLWLLARREEG